MHDPGKTPVSILIACHNEQDNILPCLESVCTHMPKAEILVIHGGNDQTAERARTWAQAHPLIRIITHPNDRGKGHAIKTGIAEARADVMAQFDADLQFRAEDLPALIAPVLEGHVDVCVGSRFLSTATDQQAYEPIWSRDMGNRILALYTSMLVGRRLTDVTTGMKAWNRKSINLIGFQDDAYSYEVELIIRAIRTGARLTEIPVSYASRSAGESMHRTRFALAKAGLRIMGHALLTRFRPL